jgi:hypothetical protein
LNLFATGAVRDDVLAEFGCDVGNIGVSSPSMIVPP